MYHEVYWYLIYCTYYTGTRFHKGVKITMAYTPNIFWTNFVLILNQFQLAEIV